MPTISSFISLGRDNLIHYLNDASFFIRNPALQDLVPQVDECRAAYLAAKANSTCGSCGGNPSTYAPCLQVLLSRLEELKKTDSSAIAGFVQYVSGQPIREDRQTNVSIYYNRPGADKPTRYEFIA